MFGSSTLRKFGGASLKQSKICSFTTQSSIPARVQTCALSYTTSSNRAVILTPKLNFDCRLSTRFVSLRARRRANEYLIAQQPRLRKMSRGETDIYTTPPTPVPHTPLQKNLPPARGSIAENASLVQVDEENALNPNKRRHLLPPFHERKGKLPMPLPGKKGFKRKRAVDESWATYNAVKSSIKKLLGLSRMIKGMPVNEAINQMILNPKRIARTKLVKLLKSAKGNAIVNHKFDPERLIVAECWLGRKSPIKAIRYHSKGRAGLMTRPRTQVTIVLRQLSEEEHKARLDQQEKNRTYRQKYQDRRKNLLMGSDPAMFMQD